MSLPGDALGTHRVLRPKGALPQPAEALDASGEVVYETEIVVDVQTLNIDAASFRHSGGESGRRRVADRCLEDRPLDSKTP